MHKRRLDRIVSVQLLSQDIFEDGSRISTGSERELQLDSRLLVVDEAGADGARVGGLDGGRDHADVDSNVTDDGDTGGDGRSYRCVDTDTSVGA